jgi:Kef-type K+ transport system membrane component KefB
VASTAADTRPPDARRWTGAAAAAAVSAALVVLMVIRPTGWANAGDPVARFLIAVMVVLAVCQLFGTILARVGQPRVVGEVIGGIVLGPSLLGAVWPDGRDWLFPPSVVSTINIVAQLGLAVFMFLLGCELRFDRAGARPRTIGLVVAGGMGLPFVCGLGIAAVTGGLLGGPSRGASTVFLGLAMSITAVPVLARILIDLRLDGTPVGAVALGAAAVGDGVAWLGLALILAVTGGGSGWQTLTAVLLAAGFVLAAVFVIRPLLAALIARIGADRHRALVPIVVATALGFAAFSQLIGFHVVVGAFLFGAVMPRGSTLVAYLDEQLRGFAISVLLPLFFVGIGLTTSVGLIGSSPARLLVFAAVLVAAIATKIVGAGAGARLAALSGRDALRIGALMNCRGVTELVVASIGYQLKLVNAFGLTVLVLTALVTTLCTAPLIHLIERLPRAQP